MSRVNKAPIGLQNLLGSQNFGDNPAELAPAIVPTLDMWNFLNYAESRAGWGSSVVLADGTVTYTAMTVPQNERWLVYAFGVNILGDTIAAGDQIEISASRVKVAGSTSPGNAHPFFGASSEFRSTPANFKTVVEHFPNYVPMGPGESISLRWSDVVRGGLAAWEVYSTIYYYRLLL